MLPVTCTTPPKGVVWHPWNAWSSPTVMDSELADMENAGITWIRTSYGGANSNTDALVQLAQKHHIYISFTLLGSYTGDQTAWKNQVTQAVNRYKYYVKYWEAGNEEDLAIGGNQSAVQTYVLHLQATYQAVKAADPTAQVLIGGLSDAAINNPPASNNFVNYLLQTNAASYFDIFAYHPYGSTVTISLSKVATLKQKLATNPAFASKPIWFNEIGWYTGNVESTPLQVPTEQAKADNLVQEWQGLQNMGVTTPIFWYLLHETVTGITGTGHALETKNPNTLQTVYLPAYTAYKNLWSTSSCPTPTPTTEGTNTPTVKITQGPTPTLTQSQGGTTFQVSLCPHGLGNCGDNVNPNGGGNTNPVHTNRTATLTFFNGQNQPAATAQDAIFYNSSAGNFQGTIPVANLPDGNYLISLRTDGLLGKQIPGIVSVIQGKPITLPTVSLVNGDINNDNQLDILDYNILIGCFGSKQMTTSCTAPSASQLAGADINDDGMVNGADYNLFLRELSVQHGG